MCVCQWQYDIRSRHQDSKGQVINHRQLEPRAPAIDRDIQAQFSLSLSSLVVCVSVIYLFLSRSIFDLFSSLADASQAAAFFLLTLSL